MKCWDTFKFHEQDLPDYSGHHLNKVFSCNSQNNSPWVYVAEYIASFYFKLFKHFLTFYIF